MVKTTATVGHGTHPSGQEKMHYTCATSKASTLASSQKQQQSPSGASSMMTSPKIIHEPEEESQDGKPIVDRKEILYAVTSRLDKILKRCNTFEHYKKNVTNLAKFTRKAVENDQGTVVQLTLADMRAVQDEIKANLSIWCDSIEGKIINLDKKKNKILENMANIGEWVERLQAVAKEIKSHIGKVTNATDKLTSNPTPYQDALLEGTGRMGRDVVDGRILYEIERKAKQILIDFKDNKTAMISTQALIDKANAHAMAVIGMAEAANCIIRDGLYICRVNIRPEKLRQEPLQCLRCRHWGHYMINCLESQDACGTCGENHCTTHCTNPDKKHCISCKVAMHVSW